MSVERMTRFPEGSTEEQRRIFGRALLANLTRIGVEPGEEFLLAKPGSIGGGTPRARNTDPGTSHAAANTVKNVRESHEAILAVLRAYGPMTDERLVEVYVAGRETHQLPLQSTSGIRTRRRELADMDPPLVVDSGGKQRMRSGRMAIVWRAV